MVLPLQLPHHLTQLLHLPIQLITLHLLVFQTDGIFFQKVFVLFDQIGGVFLDQVEIFFGLHAFFKSLRLLSILFILQIQYDPDQLVFVEIEQFIRSISRFQLLTFFFFHFRNLFRWLCLAIHFLLQNLLFLPLFIRHFIHIFTTPTRILLIHQCRVRLRFNFRPVRFDYRSTRFVVYVIAFELLF